MLSAVGTKGLLQRSTIAGTYYVLLCTYYKVPCTVLYVLYST